MNVWICNSDGDGGYGVFTRFGNAVAVGLTSRQAQLICDAHIAAERENGLRRCPGCGKTYRMAEIESLENTIQQLATAGEWTEARVRGFFEHLDKKGNPDRNPFPHLAFCINADLAAKQQELEQANVQCRTIGALMQDANNKAKELREQLAAEEEKLNGELANGTTLFRQTVELRKQLATARAALKDIEFDPQTDIIAREMAHAALEGLK